MPDPKIDGHLSSSPIRPWEVIARREALDRRPYAHIFDQDLRLPDGELIHDFLRITLRPFVNIFALINMPDSWQVPVVHQYRIGLEAVSLELPAGAINDGETPLEAAQRELLEETGLIAANWQPLGRFVMDSNYEAGVGHFFLATSVERVTDEPGHGDLGDLRSELLPLSTIRQLWHNGTINSAPNALSIALALQKIDQR